jgi:D-alanyl-D-alanine carboxypeptidase
MWRRPSFPTPPAFFTSPAHVISHGGLGDVVAEQPHLGLNPLAKGGEAEKLLEAGKSVQAAADLAKTGSISDAGPNLTQAAKSLKEAAEIARANGNTEAAAEFAEAAETLETAIRPVVVRKATPDEVAGLQEQSGANAPKVGATAKEVEIAVGFGGPRNVQLRGHAEATGGKAYWDWGEARFTSKPVRGITPEQFGQAAEEAFGNASKIHFDLTGIPDAKAAAADGARLGWEYNNLTKAELNLIKSKPDLLKKTVFYREGKPLQVSPFE